MGKCGECAGLISAIFATLAALFSLMGGFWCQTILFTPLEPPVLDIDPNFYMSPWYQQKTYINYGNINGQGYVWTTKYCVNFRTSPQVDAMWKVVQAFSIIAIVFGGCGCFCLYGSCCFPTYFRASVWRAIALKFIVLVTVSQGLTLLIFRSNACTNNNVVQSIETEVGRPLYNSTCEWGRGSSLNVTALVFWFITGVAMLVIGPPEPNPLAFDNPSSRWNSMRQSQQPAAAAEPDKGEQKDVEQDAAAPAKDGDDDEE